MSLGKNHKALGREITVAVAYVGPEPSTKMRPFSTARSITYKD